MLWPWMPPGIWLKSGRHGLVSRLPASSTFPRSPPRSLHLRLCKGRSFCLETLPGLCPKDTHLSSKPHFSSQALKEWSPFSVSPPLPASLFWVLLWPSPATRSSAPPVPRGSSRRRCSRRSLQFPVHRPESSWEPPPRPGCLGPQDSKHRAEKLSTRLLSE